MTIAFHQHILVFDSGLGGLSVAREIIAAHPHCRLSYLADNAFFPYGTKDDAQLVARILSVIRQAIVMLQPDLIVIACNTASTLALGHLRQECNLPFVGVVPAIKPAAAASRSKVVGLLATPATINRPYTEELIRNFAQSVQVVRYGSASLVAMAEAHIQGQPVDVAALREELAQLWEQPQGDRIDAVVLACTHFPLIKPLLQSVAPSHWSWIDSGEAVARQVGVWLAQLAPRAPHGQPASLYSTADYPQLPLPALADYLGVHLLQAAPLLIKPVS
jgi:glutamate racemase